MKAVILVAGRASHLRPFLADRPKALLAVAGIPILRRAIINLLACGVREFVICTGYLDHMVREAVAEWFPGLKVSYVLNPDFATTNNAYSLALAAPHVAGQPFFLIDGDVVFDVAVIERLRRIEGDALAVRLGHARAPHEMKITTTTSDTLAAIGKQLSPTQANGESLGLAWLSRGTSGALFAVLANQMATGQGRDDYYETALQRLIDAGAKLRAVDMRTLFVAEIDTVDDLCLATSRCIAAELGNAADDYAATA